MRNDNSSRFVSIYFFYQEEYFTTVLMLLLPLAHVCFRLDQHGLLISDINTGKWFYCFVSSPLKCSLLSIFSWEFGFAYGLLLLCVPLLYWLTHQFWHSNSRVIAVRACSYSWIQTEPCVTCATQLAKISTVKYLNLCKYVWCCGSLTVWPFFSAVYHGLTTLNKHTLSYRVCTYRGQTTPNCPALAFRGAV